MQLDQIFSAFDPKTRRAFETWMQQSGIALTNRGEEFNQAFAQLYPFATNVDSVLAVLNRQSAATTTLLRDGAQVFAALSSSPAALQGFVRNSNGLFAATAARDQDLADTIRAFPAFLTEARSTINRLGTFSQTTQPLIDELRPAAVQLTPALQGLVVLAPELRDLMIDIAPLTKASKDGFPALTTFLNDTVPFLVRLKPYLGELVPVIDYIQSYRREIAAFFANSTATEQGQFASGNGGRAHYVRISNPINPELLTRYSARPSSNRSNAYMAPGGYNQLLHGLSRVRQLPLHRAPAADDRLIALADHNFRHRDRVNPRATRREVLLHRPARWTAVQGAAPAGQHDHRSEPDLPQPSTASVSPDVYRRGRTLKTNDPLQEESLEENRPDRRRPRGAGRRRGGLRRLHQHLHGDAVVLEQEGRDRGQARAHRLHARTSWPRAPTATAPRCSPTS